MLDGSLDTPAKINLFLRITGKQANGYHEIETVFLPLPRPFDTIRIDETDTANITVSCAHPDVPQDGSNLVVKAAKAYSDAAGLNLSCCIAITKRIPTAAGLGGGSSDAGAVLRLLQDHFKAVDQQDLIRLAAGVGADVPFFLNPAPAIATGIGEQLVEMENIEITELPLLLIAPMFPVRAAWAYRHRIDKQPVTASANDIESALRQADWNKLADLVHNDLGEALFRKFPLLALLKKELEAREALTVAVSGSGPTLFALFGSLEKAQKAHEELKYSQVVANCEMFLPYNP